MTDSPWAIRAVIIQLPGQVHHPAAGAQLAAEGRGKAIPLPGTVRGELDVEAVAAANLVGGGAGAIELAELRPVGAIAVVDVDIVEVRLSVEGHELQSGVLPVTCRQVDSGARQTGPE
jgi:hypothetical protein